jgi:hypothetical protein
MANAIKDPFDTLLISDCEILARPDTRDEAGQLSADPVLVTTVKARLSLGRGKVREYKKDLKVGESYHMVFMRPYGDLTIKHWLRIAGKKYDIINIDNPSGMDHHYEVTVQEIDG